MFSRATEPEGSNGDREALTPAATPQGHLGAQAFVCHMLEGTGGDSRSCVFSSRVRNCAQRAFSGDVLVQMKSSRRAPTKTPPTSGTGTWPCFARSHKGLGAL